MRRNCEKLARELASEAGKTLREVRALPEPASDDRLAAAALHLRNAVASVRAARLELEAMRPSPACKAGRKASA